MLLFDRNEGLSKAFWVTFINLYVKRKPYRPPFSSAICYLWNTREVIFAFLLSSFDTKIVSHQKHVSRLKLSPPF